MEEFYLSEYVDWKSDKITKALISAFKEYRQGKMEDIADGKVYGDELQQEIGRTQGIADCLEFIIQRMREYAIDDRELEDAKSSRIQNIS